jgi:hypothetical protein
VRIHANRMNLMEGQFQALRYFTLDDTDHHSHGEQKVGCLALQPPPPPHRNEVAGEVATHFAALFCYVFVGDVDFYIRVGRCVDGPLRLRTGARPWVHLDAKFSLLSRKCFLATTDARTSRRLTNSHNCCRSSLLGLRRNAPSQGVKGALSSPV